VGSRDWYEIRIFMIIIFEFSRILNRNKFLGGIRRNVFDTLEVRLIQLTIHKIRRTTYDKINIII